VAEPLTSRARQIVAVARELLEEEGSEALTMRRLGARLGIRASSLYKHLPSKAALEAAIITVGFEEAAAAFEAAADNGTGPLATFAGAYRAFALAHPHLYRLMTEQPLPRDLLPEGLEQRAAAPLLQAMGGDPARARAAFAFAHGMVMLELTQRLPPGEDPGPAWQEGIAAFQARATAPGPRARPGRSPGACPG
jgi:AcrR family transcriptional regulator